MLSPLDLSTSRKYISFVVAFLLAPWLIDLALIVRLLAVLPFSATPRKQFLAIFLFPLAIKIARLVMLVLIAHQWMSEAGGLSQNNIQAGEQMSWAHSPYFKAEWICQIIDNA
jgi:hypothetical protein